MLHSICQQIWKSQQWPQDWKKSVFILAPKKGYAKECSNYHTIALISHASKVMLKILQARLQQYVNWELPDVQTGFRKGRGTRDQIVDHKFSLRIFQFVMIHTVTGFSVVNKAEADIFLGTLLLFWWFNRCWQFDLWFLKRWEYQTTWPASWEICMQIKKQQLELDMEQQIGSK